MCNKPLEWEWNGSGTSCTGQEVDFRKYSKYKFLFHAHVNLFLQGSKFLSSKLPLIFTSKALDSGLLKRKLWFGVLNFMLQDYCNPLYTHAMIR